MLQFDREMVVVIDLVGGPILIPGKPTLILPLCHSAFSHSLSKEELVNAVLTNDRHLLRTYILHTDVFTDITLVLRKAIDVTNMELVVMVLTLTASLWRDEPTLQRYFVDEAIKEAAEQQKTDLVKAISAFRNKP